VSHGSRTAPSPDTYLHDLNGRKGEEPVSTKDNKATLRQANAAMAAGDTEGFLSHCAEDVEWTFVGERTLAGKKDIREYLAQTYGKPPKFDVSNLIAEGDFVTALGQITITAPDGKSSAYWYCDVWRFRGGQMAELRAFVVAQASPT